MLSALELESQRTGKKQKQQDKVLRITALAKALNSFDAIPQHGLMYNSSLWPVLSKLYPDASSEWFKFYDSFGEINNLPIFQPCGSVLQI